MAHAHMITIFASHLFPEGHAPEKLLHGIVVESDNLHVRVFRIGYQRIEPPGVLGVRLNIRIIKDTGNLMPLISQYIKGIDGTRRTTHVE